VFTVGHVGEVQSRWYVPDVGPLKSIAQALDKPEETSAPEVPSGMTIQIPEIGVDAPLDELGKTPQGQIESPFTWDRPGWYDGSSRPGDGGSAVILGHVDSHTGPAVFYHLQELHASDVVTVTSDGRQMSFAVTSTASYRENALPLDKIFTSSGPSQLVLLTCAGDFNRATGRYDDRFAVFAQLISPPSPTAIP
jgi:LPXTG-site transpeptidase (sortase) family protein